MATKKKQEEKSYLLGTFVGGFIPRQKALHLRLIAAFQEGTIQDVLNKMTDLYIKDSEPKEAMVSAIADRAYLEWIRTKKTISKGDFAYQWTNYTKELSDRLTKKKLDPETVMLIVTEFKAKGR